MNLLVVSSCTGRKATSPADQLGLADFTDAERLQRRENELAAYVRPAAEMYTGDQHQYLMRGVARLRQAFGSSAVSVWILSAGYGLIPEFRSIAPYEATFNEMGRREARAWAAARRVPETLREQIAQHEATVMCLGDRYLDALGALPAAGDRRLICFAKESLRATIESSGGVFFAAGTAQTSQYGAGNVALKGRLFELLARGIAAEGQPSWHALLGDTSESTVATLIQAGLHDARR